jgi:hypothetical protein
LKKRALIWQACIQLRYYELASESAKRAKQVMPNVDTVLLTDLEGKQRWKRRFDRIVHIPPRKLVDAHFPPLSYLPEEYGLGIYMSVGAYVIASLCDVFDLVESPRVDVASVPTSGRKRDTVYPSPSVPGAYPHWRSALLAFQHHDKTRKFFGAWWELFEEHKMKYAHLRTGRGPCHPDQMVMRIALYHSDLNVVTLPLEYCCPLGGAVVRGTVRMFAGNGSMDKLAKLAAEVNRDAPHIRFWYKGKTTRL